MKIWTLFLILFCYVNVLWGQQIIYVSPYGNDEGDGSRLQPFRTLNYALKSGLHFDSSDTLTISMDAGDYYLTDPVIINKTLGRPIIIRSTGEEKTNLIGGMRISGWEHYVNGIYRAYIPEVVYYGFSFEQFYVNGQRATLARTPNEDWYIVEKATEEAFSQGVRAADYAVQRIELNPHDLSSLSGLTRDESLDIKFRFYHKWDITQKRAKFLDVDSAVIYLVGEGMKSWNPITTGTRYVMSNYQKALDVPGEWFLDKCSGYIYYMPLPGENMDDAFCIAPALHQLLKIEGKSDIPVQHITFQNISFQYASHLMPESGEEPMQAAAYTEAAIELNFARNISFIDCELMHTGSYGVWLKRECHHNTIEHCYLADLGAGGIKIGEPFFRKDGRPVSSHNVVNNSILQHIGSELPCGVGIAIFHSSDNRITHNDIGDLRYSGVSLGWFWGYNQSMESWTTVLNKQAKDEFYQDRLVSPAVRNTVEHNHIHHIGWGELSDMGAIYTLGESPGTSISNNVIHDVLSFDYGGWGLYTDEGSTGVVMRNNLVYRCKSGGFHQHYGKENLIENNIFAFGFYYQAQFTRVEEHLSFHFRRNIILQDSGETLEGIAWKIGNIDIDNNLYWSLDKDLSFAGFSTKEWKKIKEPHAMVANPLFMNAEADDFRFKSLRNVRKIGFVPFDYSKVGVYGSEEWKAKAQLPSGLLEDFMHKATIRLNK